LQLISSLEVGGAERLLIHFANSCSEKTQVPQVVVVMNDRVDKNLVEELNSTAVPAYYLGRPESSRNPRYLLELIKIIRKHNVAVIHSHTRGSKYWSALCRIFRLDLKLAHTFHSTRISMSAPAVLFHNSFIDVSIAVSQAVGQSAHGLSLRRVEQIENGIPTSLFFPIEHQPLVSRVRVICIGRLFLEDKGQDVLIRAVRRCVDRGLDVECTLVGNPAVGDLQTVPMLKALVAKLQLDDRVHFVQGRTDVATMLGEASIFVLPSRQEGFGLALVEAMAAGLPVIASNLDGPRTIVTDGIDGLLFEPGSDEQLAEKIQTLVQAPAMASELSKNARKRSRDYDIAAMRDKYMTVYRRLISAG
jgi:glycosyltransferase involved in cell wall biosynthesis